MSDAISLKSVAANVGRHALSVDSVDKKLANTSLILSMESSNLSTIQTLNYADDLRTVLKALGGLNVYLSVELPTDERPNAQIVLKADNESKDALAKMARAIRNNISDGPSN